MCRETMELDPLEDDGSTTGADGSLAWNRGDRVDVERMPQCTACAAALAFTMFRRWVDDEDGGG